MLHHYQAIFVPDGIYILSVGAVPGGFAFRGLCVIVPCAEAFSLSDFTEVVLEDEIGGVCGVCGVYEAAVWGDGVKTDPVRVLGGISVVVPGDDVVHRPQVDYRFFADQRVYGQNWEKDAEDHREEEGGKSFKTNHNLKKRFVCFFFLSKTRIWFGFEDLT